MSDFSRKEQPIQVKIVDGEKKSGPEKYLRYAPLAYFYLIIYSYVGLDTYYSEFGIKILGYMSVQEMLVLPLENIKGILTIMITSISLFVVISTPVAFTNYPLFFDKSKSIGLKFEEVLIDIKKGFLFFLSDLYFLLIFIIVYLIVTVLMFFNINVVLNTGLFSYALIISVVFVFVFHIWKHKWFSSYNRFNSEFLVRRKPFLIIVFLVFLIFYNYSLMLENVGRILLRKANQVEVKVKGQNIDNVKALLLGTTNSTVFLYDTDKAESFLIPKSEIKELRYINHYKTESIEASEPILTPLDSLELIRMDSLNNPDKK